MIMPTLLTSELIQSVIEAMPAQGRVMLRLLLLQYLDLTDEDIRYIAGDRPDPRFQSGEKPFLDFITRETIQGITDRAAEYQERVRKKRERLGLIIECMRRQIAISERLCVICERLLLARDLTQEAVAELRRTARTIVLKQALREVQDKFDEQAISDDEFRTQRLALEFQLHLRLLDRHRRRVEQAQRDQQNTGPVPLHDHEIAHIWGIPASSLAGRKAKYLHQYLEAVQAKLRQAGETPNPKHTAPVDLWRETFAALARGPIPRSVVTYDGMEGSEDTLLQKLRAFTVGGLPEDAESRLWMNMVQDVRHGAEHGARPFSLFALQRLSAILSETDSSDDVLEREVLGRIEASRAVEASEQPEDKKPEEVQLGDMAEHVLRSLRGG